MLGYPSHGTQGMGIATHNHLNVAGRLHSEVYQSEVYLYIMLDINVYLKDANVYCIYCY